MNDSEFDGLTPKEMRAAWRYIRAHRGMDSEEMRDWYRALSRMPGRWAEQMRAAMTSVTVNRC